MLRIPRVEEQVMDLKAIERLFNERRFKKMMESNIAHVLCRTDKKTQFVLTTETSEIYTDGSKIVVGLPEDCKGKTYAEIYSMVKACVGHESAHVKWSNFNALKGYIEEVRNRKIAVSIGHSIFNIIEDGRIERLLCEELPGYTKHIQFLNLQLIKRDGNVKDRHDIVGNIISVMLFLSVLGMYPTNYEKLLKKKERELVENKIHPLILKGVLSNSYKVVQEVCLEILDLLKPYIPEQQSMPQELRDLLEALAQETYQSSEGQDGNDSRDLDELVSTIMQGMRSSGGSQNNSGKSKPSQSSDNQEEQKNDDSENNEDKDSNSQQNSNQNQGTQGNANTDKSDDDKRSGDDNSGAGQESAGDEEDSTEKQGSGQSKNSQEEISNDENNSSGEGSGNNDSDKESDKKEGSSSSEDVKDESSETNQSSEENNKSDKNNSNSADSNDASNDSQGQSNASEDAGNEADDLKNSDKCELLPSHIKDPSANSSSFSYDDKKDFFENLKEEIESEAQRAFEKIEKQEKRDRDNQRNAFHEGIDVNGINSNYSSSRQEPDFKFIYPNLPTNKPQAEFRMKIHGLKKMFEKMLKNQEANYKGQKRGRLDTSRLWRVGINDSNIFKKKNIVEKTDYAVEILIDASGSMCNKVKYRNAIGTAICIEAALTGLEGVEVKTVAFNFDDGTHMFVLKDFKDTESKTPTVYNYDITDGSNRDGFAIRVALDDLKKRNAKNKLLIVISDGMPNARPFETSNESIEDVKNAVHKGRKDATIVSILINDGPIHSKLKEVFHYMYEDKGSILVDVANEPEDLMKNIVLYLKKMFKN